MDLLSPLIRRPLAAWIVVGGLAASCAGPAAQPVEPAPTVVETAVIELAAAPTEEPSPAPALPPTAGPTPTVRPGMEATDPTTVVLASGDPTFVEFFAFW
ncbi:MAG TPA: hypothetical protein VGA32_06170 [Anaerolineales bacterium]